MTVTVTFGTCSDAVNVLHKSPTLNESSVTCVVKDTVNVESPYLIVDSGTVNDTDNWCEIAEFNRKYWITVEDLPGGRKGVICQVDTLASFEDDIAAMPVYVARNEHTEQSYLYDTEIPTKAKMYVNYKKFTGSNLPAKSTSDSDMRYLLILK